MKKVEIDDEDTLCEILGNDVVRTMSTRLIFGEGRGRRQEENYMKKGQSSTRTFIKHPFRLNTTFALLLVAINIIGFLLCGPRNSRTALQKTNAKHLMPPSMFKEYHSDAMLR